MGGKQIRPARVYKTVLRELQHEVLPGIRDARPPWLEVMHHVPPAETLVRAPRVEHRNIKVSSKGKPTKPRNLYKPQQIVYPEDRLRSTFYKDHPWELARPRIMVEKDGKDYQTLDWSKGLQQRGVPLTGESVVQRQLWLMENEKMPRNQAYDTVRREFYRFRQEEQIEKRLALEEARYVGAYFGKTRLDVGLILEDNEYENWKVWAGKQAELRKQATMAVDDIEGDDDAADVTTEEVTSE